MTRLARLAMIAALVRLLQGIPEHLEAPRALLRSAIALWLTNIVISALWYWKLDAGGPLRRELPNGMASSAFLFPQMTRKPGGDPSWVPNFVDYLFLAFNTSTAFSPTDTAVLSRWAKLGTMLQSLISLTIIALLAAMYGLASSSNLPGVIALVVQKFMIVLSTAFSGAYLIMAGIWPFVVDNANISRIWLYPAPNNSPGHLGYGALALWVLFTLIGVGAQLRGRRKKAEPEPVKPVV